MGQESTEVQMARLEERLKVILERLDEARNDQQASQQNIGLITQTLQSISSRVEIDLVPPSEDDSPVS